MILNRESGFKTSVCFSTVFIGDRNGLNDDAQDQEKDALLSQQRFVPVMVTEEEAMAIER